MLPNAAGEDEPVEARKRGCHRRDAGGGPANEHVDGEPGTRVSLPSGLLELAHPGGPAEHPDQPGLVIERGLELPPPCPARDRKSTRLNSSHVEISYAVFC